MLASIVTLLFALALQTIEGKPDVQKRVYQMMAKQSNGVVLVTFRPTDLAAAEDPERMLKLARLQKRILDIPIKEFVATGTYHQQRGRYVFEKVTEHHRLTEKHLKNLLPGVKISSSIPISNSFLITVNDAQLGKLLNDPEVVEIHTNEPFHVALPTIKMDKAMPSKSVVIPHRLVKVVEERQEIIQWNVGKIGADRVWTMGGPRSRGQGIVYAIADTGVAYQHPNIFINYLGRRTDGSINHNYAWYDGVRREVAQEGEMKCPIGSPVPCDDQGHGTHVTSTAVGGDGFGVAPGARWMACRNMDRGVGSPETYLNCLNFFLAPHDLQGGNARPDLRPHVVGNSYGCPDSEGCSKHAMTAAMEALRAAGVFMSVSAGNEGPRCGTISDPPALEKSVISVAATDVNDNLADFSSRGPCSVAGTAYRKPDVSAPGVRVLAAYPGDGYRVLSGTSMASPHVGGAVALISAMCPCLLRNVDAIQDLLQSTALPLFPPKGQVLCGIDEANSVPNNHFGYGRINVLAAVKKCRAICAGQSSRM